MTIRASDRSTRYWKEIGRAQYERVTDAEALDAFQWTARTEGIIPPLESSHALAYVRKFAPTLPKDQIVLVFRPGRGDKDVDSVAGYLKL